MSAQENIHFFLFIFQLLELLKNWLQRFHRSLKQVGVIGCSWERRSSHTILVGSHCSSDKILVLDLAHLIPQGTRGNWTCMGSHHLLKYYVVNFLYVHYPILIYFFRERCAGTLHQGTLSRTICTICIKFHKKLNLKIVSLCRLYS